MEFLKVILSSVLSIVIMYIIIKVIGNRSIAQMTAFDYLNGITVGSIAAELATNIEGDMLYPIIALIVYGAAIFLINILTLKSVKMRAFFTGRPIVILDNDKISKAAMKKARLDINEFLMLLRCKGYFDLSQIKTVMFEENGTLSILPKAGARPLQPQDVKIAASEETYFTSIIADGEMLEENVKKLGKDDIWLKQEMDRNRISGIGDVFLAVCDKNGKAYFYKMTD